MKSRSIRSALLALGSLVVCLGVYGAGLFDSWQEKIYDRMFTAAPQSEQIVVVGIDDITISELGGWPLARSNYAQVLPFLAQAKAVAFDIFFAEKSRFGETDDALFAASLKASPVPVIIPIELRDRGGVNVALLPELASSSLLSFANIPVSHEGIARLTDTRREGIPSIACAMADDACPNTASVRINYIGKEKSILTVSFIDVISGRIPSSVFKDAYVLVGATAESLHDVVGTPFGDMPGVEVHAQILHTMLAGNYFSDTSPVLMVLLLILIHMLVVMVVHASGSFRKLILNLAALGAVVVIYPIIAFNFDIRAPFIYLFIGYVLPTALLLLYEYISTSKEKKFIEETFKYYLMPDVINDLKNNPHKLKLGGEKRMVTILFSDIRGFTTISEKLAPEELTRVINEYLTAMTDIIMDHSGLVDKYIGDAIMAFWGAPVENAHQAQNAAQAVIAMSEKLKELNTGWKERGIPEIAIGVGLNKGEVIVGNMGSEKRFNYTIMGDEVNFGSRLEGLTKKYGVECLVSESVAEEIKEQNKTEVGFLIREMDLVLVKGKKEPKKIFELITHDIGDEKKDAVQLFEKGLAAYKAGKWDEALEIFNSSQNDAPAQIFAERVSELKANPPKEWKGVYEHTSK